MPYFLFPFSSKDIFFIIIWGIYVHSVCVDTHMSQNISENMRAILWSQSFPYNLCRLRERSDHRAYMISTFIHWAIKQSHKSLFKIYLFFYNFEFVLISAFYCSINLLLYLFLENDRIRVWRFGSMVNSTCYFIRGMESISKYSHPEWVMTFYNSEKLTSSSLLCNCTHTYV